MSVIIYILSVYQISFKYRTFENSENTKMVKHLSKMFLCSLPFIRKDRRQLALMNNSIHEFPKRTILFTQISHRRYSIHIFSHRKHIIDNDFPDIFFGAFPKKYVPWSWKPFIFILNSTLWDPIPLVNYSCRALWYFLHLTLIMKTHIFNS